MLIPMASTLYKSFRRLCLPVVTATKLGTSHGSAVADASNKHPLPPASRQYQPYPQTYLASAQQVVPAPTITVHMSTLNGEATVTALPHSGADISIAGPSLLHQLNEHPHNLIQSTMVPRAVNGSTMQPLGKLPINITLNNCQLNEEFHIYPQVSGVLLSWQVAKRLNILSAHYPKPVCPQDPPKVAAIGVLPPGDIQNEYPMVFDGMVKSMEGEYFHIALTDDAKPFCVRTPRTIPFAFRDKLKAALDLLQEQNIIAPVNEPTDWCALIVVTPKKGTEKIRMCVDLSHLNKYVKRERYQCSTPAEAVTDIASHNAKIFIKLDALKGYHQSVTHHLYHTTSLPHGLRELSTTLQMPYPGILHLTHKPATCWQKTPLHAQKSEHLLPAHNKA